MDESKKITKLVLLAFFVASVLMLTGFLIFRNTKRTDPDFIDNSPVNNLTQILEEIKSVDLGKEDDGFSALENELSAIKN